MSKEVKRTAPRAVAVAKPPEFEIITRQAKGDLLAEIKRGSLAGEYGGVSPVLWSGPAGVWAVKVHRLRPASTPRQRPAWHRSAAILAAVVVGVLAAVAALLAAVAYVLGAISSAAAAVPWGAVGGVGVLALLLLVGTKAGRSVCSFTITHHH